MADPKEPMSLKEIELAKQAANLSAEELQKLEKRYELLEKIIKLEEQDLEEAKRRLFVAEELEKRETDEVEKKRLKNDIAKEAARIAELEYRTLLDRGGADEKAIEDARKKYEETRRELTAQEKITEQLEKQKKTNSLILQSLISMTGELGRQIATLTTVQGLASVFGKTVDDVIKSQQTLQKNFSGIEFSVSKMTQGMSQFSVGVTEATNAANDLLNNMSAFSTLNENVRNGLVQNVAKMEQMGVATSVSSKNFNELNKGLGISATQVGNVSDKIVKALGPAGISPAKALSDLNAVLPQLSSSGQKAVDIYIQLSKQAKALGMDVSELTGIVGSSFDTFEGAADKAGKLNAILGGDYLNSVEMLNATEEERVDLLRKAFQETGKDFDNLDRFEKKAIMASLGISNMNQARKLFGALSVEEQIRMEREAASQKELEQAQIKSADAMKKLQIAVSNLVVALEPLIKIVRNVIDFMAEHNVATSILFGTLAVLRLGGINPLASAFSALGDKMASFLNVTKAAPDALNGTAGGMNAAGGAAASSWQSILAFGGAIMMIGVGIAIAAAGISKLVEAFKGLDNVAGALTAIGLIFVGFGALIFVMSKFLTAAIPEVLAFGAAILLIGAGIGIAAFGIAELVKSFSGLDMKQIIGAGAAIGAIALGLYFLVGALITAIPATAAAGLAFAAAAPGFWALGGAIALIGLGIGAATFGASKFATSLTELNKSGMNISGLMNIKNAIGEIIEIIEKIPQGKEFTAKIDTIRNVSYAVVGAANIDEVKLKPAIEFVKAATDYQRAQFANTNAANDKLLETLKSALKPEKTTGNETEKDVRVIIQVDNTTQLEGWVTKIANGQKAGIFNRG